jgi:RNA polymerase sigma-B factor
MTECDPFPDLRPRFERLRMLPVGDPQRLALRAALITECLGLATRIARRHAWRETQLPDVEQVAALGLVHAVDGFDPGYGKDFLSYAVPTISGYVLRYFRDHNHTVRVPRSVAQLVRDVEVAGAKLAQELGRTPLSVELATRAGVTLADARRARLGLTSLSTWSLDESPLGSEGVSRLEWALGVDDRGLTAVEERHRLDGMLAALPPRERRIVLLRFVDDLTQQQIADRTGVSQMQISRLLARALRTLRRHGDAEAC